MYHYRVNLWDQHIFNIWYIYNYTDVNIYVLEGFTCVLFVVDTFYGKLLVPYPKDLEL